MSNQIEEPAVSRELIKYLDRILPPKDHKPGDTLEDIMFRAGKRQIINHLRMLSEPSKHNT